MTKKQKSAKRAFISSVLSVILCFTMLVGTTFAWYNDSVTSGRNTIVSGSLEMVLEKYIGTDGDFSKTANWETVTDQTKIFNETNGALTFEPGAVQVAYVRISNKGDLAFKYSLAAKVYGEETKGTNQAGVEYKLSDYLKFGTKEVSAVFATREAAIAAVPNATKLQDATLSADGAKLEKGAAPVIVALVIYMPSDVGNDANPQPDKKPEISFGLNALASQATIENDSFSNDYDAASPLPFTPVANLTQLSEAIAEDGGNALLNDDVDTSARLEITNDTTIEGNGNTIKVDNGDNRVIDISDTIEPTTVTLNNVNIDGSDSAIDPNAYARGISLYGNKDVTLNAKGTTITSPYYAINVAGANENVTINLENASVAAGWAGLNIWSKSTVNVKDSLISGTNDKTYNADGWNNFGTIVMNYETGNSTNGSVLNFENTTIKGSMTTGNRQLLVDIRDDGITMNFTNCTFISEGTPASQFADIMIKLCMNEHLTFTNCKFIKNGVEVDIKDYIGYYPGNNDGSSVIIVNGVTLNNNDIPEISK